MLDNKHKTSLIIHIQKCITQENWVMLGLCTCIILSYSFVIYFFCVCHLGSFPSVYI